ncbi:hypothetical protein SKAU_G00043930 [Synaphobranchus kaupii]|uniref:Uncharacterized protein n=1 Tax=Synaphobranchus kaupii TaxID=118154 RepID=A0A9Q1G2I4_SYNKA|nr:hypothetical protein SKAU_G00043930 [Synaphobranchus kaupii]
MKNYFSKVSLFIWKGARDATLDKGSAPRHGGLTSLASPRPVQSFTGARPGPCQAKALGRSLQVQAVPRDHGVTTEAASFHPHPIELITALFPGRTRCQTVGNLPPDAS